MRYLRLLGWQLRKSVLLAAQYRWDFIVDGGLAVAFSFVAIIPLLVVYRGASTGIPGWSLGEALVVTGWYILMEAILEGAINPGLQTVIEDIRKGTLDFLLLKPADAQFLVSTSRFQLFRVFSFANALVVFTIAFYKLGRVPTIWGIASALLLLCAGSALLYSMWILVVSLAFVVVKVDNLSRLFSSLFDAARWPVSVFGGALKIFFTFILPFAVMTTFPAEALLGRLDSTSLIASIGGAAVFFLIARFVWKRAISHYSSAGG